MTMTTTTTTAAAAAAAAAVVVVVAVVVILVLLILLMVDLLCKAFTISSECLRSAAFAVCVSCRLGWILQE